MFNNFPVLSDKFVISLNKKKLKLEFPIPNLPLIIFSNPETEQNFSIKLITIIVNLSDLQSLQGQLQKEKP
jgi:hypothetical protein